MHVKRFKHVTFPFTYVNVRSGMTNFTFPMFSDGRVAGISDRTRIVVRDVRALPIGITTGNTTYISTVTDHIEAIAGATKSWKSVKVFALVVRKFIFLRSNLCRFSRTPSREFYRTRRAARIPCPKIRTRIRRLEQLKGSNFERTFFPAIFFKEHNY